MRVRPSLLARALSIPALVAVVAVQMGPPAGAGTTYQDNPFGSAGTVATTGSPAPDASYTGSFTLGSLNNNYGMNGGQQNGQITVYETSQTRYYKSPVDSGGNNLCQYAPSTMGQVVVINQNVFVAGRYIVTGGQYTFYANYVWNPPTTTCPPPPANPGNPKPQGAGDIYLRRLFAATGFTSENGTGLVGGALWSPLWGFTMGFSATAALSDYGCSASPCHVQEIALAHGNHLRIDTTEITTYWLNGQKTTAASPDYFPVRNATISQGQTAGIFVTGRYDWDGTDWRFFATNVFSPPPTPGTTLLETVQTDAGLAETNSGTYDPTTNTWAGSQWQGQTNNISPGLGLGTITMTLDWHFTWVAQTAAGTSPVPIR